MGGSISKTFSDKMAENQKNGQETMRRTMLATQVAARRDLVQWMGATWCLLASGVTVAAAKRKLPPAAAVPFTIFSIVLAYNWDFAYGNKLERINAEYEKITTQEKHWYVPLNPKDATQQEK